AALPEVVGDAGLLFDAEREEELTAVLARVLSDAALAEDLRRRSLARAGLYTPARTTGRVLALLRDVNDGAAAVAGRLARTRGRAASPVTWVRPRPSSCPRCSGFSSIAGPTIRGSTRPATSVSR